MSRFWPEAKAAERTMVCYCTFCVYDDKAGREYTVTRGTRLKESAREVELAPGYFVADTDPFPDELAAVQTPPEPEQAEPELVIATHSFQVDVGFMPGLSPQPALRLVRAGDRLRADDPTVVAHPAAFRPLPPNDTPEAA